MPGQGISDAADRLGGALETYIRGGSESYVGRSGAMPGRVGPHSVAYFRICRCKAFTRRAKARTRSSA